MYFSTRILTPVFQNNSKYIALAIILTKIPMTLVPAIIVRVCSFPSCTKYSLTVSYICQRVGSKSILLGSAGTMALASVLLAIGINQNISGLSIIAIVTFVSAFSVGLGPVTWAVLSEVMPPHARTASGSIGLALNWSMNFIMVRF